MENLPEVEKWQNRKFGQMENSHNEKNKTKTEMLWGIAKIEKVPRWKKNSLDGKIGKVGK